MDTLRQDIRYGIRSLLRSPGFTTAALLSLALGIGANTAIFTLANAVFLHPLPVSEPTRVMEVYTVDHATTTTVANLVQTPVSYLNYVDYSQQNEVFTGLAAFFQSRVTVTGQGTPTPQAVELVTANYFDVLGVKPALGRTFQPNEDKQTGGNAVTVISHGLWIKMFGADPGVINRIVNFNSTPYTIIGVTPPGFKGTQTIADSNVAWIPMSMHGQVLSGQFEAFFNERRARLMNVFGRLKPGVPPAQALAAMKTVAARLEQEYPKANKGRSVELGLLSDAALGFLPRDQMVLAGVALSSIVGVLLLIASANLANLLLARSARRMREMSIRTALGAERGRLVRQLLTENLLLFFTGGALGLLVGAFGARLLWSFRPAGISADGIPLNMDAKVFLFTAGITVLTGVLFGMIPAFRGSRANLAETLKAGGRTGSEAIARSPLRIALVAGELALALVGLTCAGLFVRSMQKAEEINPGFETRNLLVFNLDVASRQYSPEKAKQFLQSVLNEASQTPGVQSVGLATNAPIGGGIMRTTLIEGQAADDRGTMTMANIITPGYFPTMKIPVLDGRNFSEFDRDNTNRVAVVSEAMARHFWPGQSAVGKRFRFATDNSLREIVGVVGNSAIGAIGEQPQPIAYLPMEQEFSPAVTVHVRTASNPGAVLRPVMARVQALDGDLALTNSNTIQEVIDQNLWAPRVGAALFGIFGLLGLALASVGVYGVMAHTVAQRTNEIGIRMALGAPATNVIAMVVGQSLKIAVLGIGIGIVAALGVTGLMQSLLFGIGPRDPLTFLAVSGVLLLVALVAGFIPARRAARIDPVAALREA